MKPLADIYLQYETEVDRQYLLDRARDATLGANVHVVYIYTLAIDSVNYPNKAGRVLYIGEAGRGSEPTGKRFAQHISTGINKGGDSGTIYSLSRYYYLGKKIRLQIFSVESERKRKEAERELLNAHVKEYGSLPICQGTTGDNYKTSNLASLITNSKQLAFFNPPPKIN